MIDVVIPVYKGLEATRRCLEALIAAVGNRKVSLVGTTGSGRELVGAYLGTEFQKAFEAGLNGGNAVREHHELRLLSVGGSHGGKGQGEGG